MLLERVEVVAHLRPDATAFAAAAAAGRPCSLQRFEERREPLEHLGGAVEGGAVEIGELAVVQPLRRPLRAWRRIAGGRVQ